MAPPMVMQSPPGPETVFDGRPYLYFGGTSYLGLAAHPEVLDAACSALRIYGVHTATSRSRFGTNPALIESERQAAGFFGTEEALHVASGYSSARILVATLRQRADGILVDRGAHASVLEAAHLSGLPVAGFQGTDPADLTRATGSIRHPLLMADAVSPVMGRIAPVDAYVEFLQRFEAATLLLDDAHGIGVLGTDGRGVYDGLRCWPRVNQEPDSAGVHLCVVGTLSKALGGFGGIIPASREFHRRIRENSPQFDSASAPATPVAAASAKALEVARREPELRARLQTNVQYLRAGLRRLGLEVPDGCTAHLGLAIGDRSNMQRLHEGLKRQGILLPYIGGYSDTPAEGALRCAVFATHTAPQIDALLAELGRLL